MDGAQAVSVGEAFPSCPLCGGAGVVLFHDRVFDLPGAKVLECPGCTLLFLHPYMSEAEQAAFYADYHAYYVRRVAVAGGVATPETIFRLGLPEARQRVRRFLPLLQGRKVLEIGCGAGSFLHLAARVAASVAGVERHDAAREHVARVITSKVVAELSLVKGRYDVIVLFHVLEHIVDPVGFLREVTARLKKGGCVILELPSREDPLISLYDLPVFKDFIFQREHPYVYGERSLRGLLGRVGFRVERVIPIQRYGLANHLVWLREGRPGGNGAWEELLSRSDRVYRRELEEKGVTDTLCVVCEKRAGE